MKKIPIILLGIVAFACGDASTIDQNATTNESVDIGAGENISPQLEPAFDSSKNFNSEDSIKRFKVDTVSSASEINETQHQ